MLRALKEKLINELVTHLSEELDELLNAAKAAHAASVDEQSIAETQYDTLAIEAGYLAEGQSQRVVALSQAKSELQSLGQQLSPHSHVRLGTLVQLANDKSANHWFFLSPACAGYRTSLENKAITVITPDSPVGRALVGKAIDEEVMVSLANTQLNDDIIAIE